MLDKKTFLNSYLLILMIKLISNTGEVVGTYRNKKLAMDALRVLYSIGAYEELKLEGCLRLKKTDYTKND